MYNRKNIMCKISLLSDTQVWKLLDKGPHNGSCEFNSRELYIGFSLAGTWGTWDGMSNPVIISYVRMIELLGGKPVNKQTAQEQMKVLQREMDKLKAIIATPEVKTGRVMSGDDLRLGSTYWYTYGRTSSSSYLRDRVDSGRIDAGSAFHDEQSAQRHLEYLKLEQELRRAQIADGGKGIHTILLRRNNSIGNEIGSVYHEKISFNTVEARDTFRSTHTDAQLTLLIKGV
jgi:hypothetical protein